MLRDYRALVAMPWNRQNPLFISGDYPFKFILCFLNQLIRLPQSTQWAQIGNYDLTPGTLSLSNGTICYFIEVGKISTVSKIRQQRLPKNKYIRIAIIEIIR
jgi:hypothetical protein